MNRRQYMFSAVSALTLASTTRLQGQETPPPEVPAEVPDGGLSELSAYAPNVRMGVMIPMRDGVQLAATLYLPPGPEQPRPAVFSHSPYLADQYHAEGIHFSTHGFPYLAVDMRGRGDSEGEFDPFGSEPDDGHDITAWIAEQPFCNGKVAMNGLSWVGYTQWAAVQGNAPLATIVPSAPCWAGFDFPMNNNIFYTQPVPWLGLTEGNTLRQNMNGDGIYQLSKQIAFLESGLPFRQLDAFYGETYPKFQEWLDHPIYDDYWASKNPSAEQLAALTIPVLTLCGYFDGDQPGALRFHREHLKNAGADAEHYLVIGPWGHEQVRKPSAEYVGIPLGEASVIDTLKLHSDWYGWTMGDGQRPEFLQDKVAYYVMVANKWRYAPTLEDVTERFDVLHLHASGNADNVYNSGRLLAEPAESSEPGHYVYDPADLSPILRSLEVSTSPFLDQSIMLDEKTPKLVYHTAPFEADTEVSGFFKFEAWMAIDQKDTDFLASLYAIDRNGASTILTEQRLRARHREGLDVEQLIETTEPLLYTFDRFPFVSRMFQPGQRIRLVLRPHQHFASQRNYNSGKPVADETRADARVVTVRLFQDAEHPSALSIPIGRPEESA